MSELHRLRICTDDKEGRVDIDGFRLKGVTGFLLRVDDKGRCVATIEMGVDADIDAMCDHINIQKPLKRPGV